MSIQELTLFTMTVEGSDKDGTIVNIEHRVLAEKEATAKAWVDAYYSRKFCIDNLNYINVKSNKIDAVIHTESLMGALE